MQHYKRIALVLAAISACAASAAGAQETAECTAIIDSLARIPRPVIDDTTRVTLVWRSAFCDARGPAQIARLWSLPDLTDSEYTALAWYSTVADVRLADTLMVIARRTSVRGHGRTTALFALSQQVTSVAPMVLSGLLLTGRSDSIWRSPHGGASPGGRPLTDADRQRIITTFADLSVQTAVPTVQHAARGALRASAEAYPRLTSVPANTVTLTYMCGNRFRLRNRSSVWGAFTYDVYGTAERRTIDVPVSVAPTVASEIFFTTKARGTVRVFWQNRLLQTKANGGTVCSS